MKRGCKLAKLPFVPQSLNAERPAWMPLLCATVHHRKMPNRITDRASNNTTPLRLCLPGHLCRLAYCSISSFNRISLGDGVGEGKKLLVSEPSAGVLFLGWLLNCNSNTVTSADPRHYSWKLQHFAPISALDILSDILYPLSSSQRKGISPAQSCLWRCTSFVWAVHASLLKAVSKQVSMITQLPQFSDAL